VSRAGVSAWDRIPNARGRISQAACGQFVKSYLPTVAPPAGRKPKDAKPLYTNGKNVPTMVVIY